MVFLRSIRTLWILNKMDLDGKLKNITLRWVLRRTDRLLISMGIDYGDLQFKYFFKDGKLI